MDWYDGSDARANPNTFQHWRAQSVVVIMAVTPTTLKAILFSDSLKRSALSLENMTHSLMTYYWSAVLDFGVTVYCVRILCLFLEGK